MKRASKVLNQTEMESIKQAVAEAEKKTSAEIVPVMATASGRYDRGEDVFGLLVSVIALGCVMVAMAKQPQNTWNNEINWLNVVICCTVVLVGFSAGAAVASYVGCLKLIFTPRREKRAEVQMRAMEAFAANKAYGTRNASGLVIYVSLLERMVAIYADTTVMEKLGQSTIDELRDFMVAKLKNGNVSAAFCETIAAAGQKLSAVMPIEPDDVNELPNGLIVID